MSEERHRPGVAVNQKIEADFIGDCGHRSIVDAESHNELAASLFVLQTLTGDFLALW